MVGFRKLNPLQCTADHGPFGVLSDNGTFHPFKIQRKRRGGRISLPNVPQKSSPTLHASSQSTSNKIRQPSHRCVNCARARGRADCRTRPNLCAPCCRSAGGCGVHPIGNLLPTLLPTTAAFMPSRHVPPSMPSLYLD